MSINVGDVVEFNTVCNPNNRLGKVVEITEVKDSIDDNRTGKIEYHLDILDDRLQTIVVGKDNISSYYSKLYEVSKDEDKL